MALVTSLLILIHSYSIYSETIVCDGVTRDCQSNPTINCTDNEQCIIQCTGSSCVSTNINCPINGDCEIQCLAGADNGGCQVTSINAENSLSLTLNNIGQKRDAFQYSTIYCPFNGSCTIISNNGRDAVRDLNIYSLYGFAFNALSISCSGGPSGSCQRGNTLYCGNDYTLSSCIIDEDTGSNCDSTSPSTLCDTIFTVINGTWTDDYNINPAPGWVVTDYAGNNLPNTVFKSNTTSTTYHGPFVGDTNSAMSDVEWNDIVQYFYCPIDATVDIHYYFSFGCGEMTDGSTLYVNDVELGFEHAQPGTGADFHDRDLEQYVNKTYGCTDAWYRKQMVGRSGLITANTSFKVLIDIAMNFEKEAGVISDIQIACIPPTSAPTENPTTAAPTSLSPTTVSPTTAIPTTAAPTSLTPDPTTSSPTVSTSTSDPTTAEPTIQPTTSNPTRTRGPTFDPTTSEPTVDTDEPTRSPKGKGSGIQLGTTQNIQTRESTDVDASGLFIAAGIIGGLFVIAVVLACRAWMKHEKDYKPTYLERREEILNTKGSIDVYPSEQMEMELAPTTGVDDIVYENRLD